ncbi:hypothetical protein KHQ88_05360 [Mycoplasmatota bacterium]|nr:hypothetical protein KHQ88_05360 [Mycoplasmatota bacterium]
MKQIKLLIIFPLLLILAACSNEPTINYQYSDYNYYKISSFDEQLNHPQNEYYIYYYYEACGSCQYIKNDVLSRISNLDEDHLYLFDVRAGIDIHPSEYIRDESDGKFYTPTMVHVKDGEFVGKWVGIDEVLSILVTLE